MKAKTDVTAPKPIATAPKPIAEDIDARKIANLDSLKDFAYCSHVTNEIERAHDPKAVRTVVYQMLELCYEDTRLVESLVLEMTYHQL